MTVWEIVNTYRRLISVGKANPIACPKCCGTMITRAGEDSAPVMWCPPCAHTIKIGFETLDQMREQIKRVYE